VAVTLNTNLVYHWAAVEVQGFHGMGMVLPRLSVTLKMSQLTAGDKVRVEGLTARLKLESELLAVALPLPLDIEPGRQFEAEFPLLPPAIAAIQAREANPTIVLSMEFAGLHHIFRDPPTADTFVHPVPLREWTMVPVEPTPVTLSIPRSDWYSKILEPIGAYRYLLYALTLPKADAAGSLASAVKQIADAERAFALGDDPAVFLRCRGAWDALPGNKTAIFDIIADTTKRSGVDELGKRFGQFLHAGRHVATDGSEQGDFPVDHRDAEFALNMTKLFVGYVSRLQH